MVLTAISQFFWSCIWAIVKFLFIYACIGAAAGLTQERKNWTHDTAIGIGGHVKIFFFLLVWMVGSGISCMILSPLFLIKYKDAPRILNTFFEYHLASNLFKVFCGVIQVVGAENVADDEPCVYVFNHQTQLDICATYEVRKYFCWVAKKNVVFLPGVGQIMYFGKHILLDRTGAGAAEQLYEKALTRLNDEKRSIYIFPQGTRSRKQINSFKNGAFGIALKTGVPIVPCTIEFDNECWKGGLFKKTIGSTITIGEKIMVDKENDTVEGLREKCYKICNAPYFGKVPEKLFVKKVKEGDKKAD